MLPLFPFGCQPRGRENQGRLSCHLKEASHAGTLTSYVSEHREIGSR